MEFAPTKGLNLAKFKSSKVSLMSISQQPLKLGPSSASLNNPDWQIYRAQMELKMAFLETTLTSK